MKDRIIMNWECISQDFTLSRFTSITAIPTQTPRITPLFLRSQSSTLDTQPCQQGMETNEISRTTGKRVKRDMHGLEMILNRQSSAKITPGETNSTCQTQARPTVSGLVYRKLHFDLQKTLCSIIQTTGLCICY